MRPTRYSTTRQKACHRCAASKAKCDRKAGTCARCEQRGLHCVYPQTQPPLRPEEHTPAVLSGTDDVEVSPSLTSTLAPSSFLLSPDDGVSDGAGGSVSVPPISTITALGSTQPEQLDFTDLDLTCPINPDDIANRWLNNFVPLPGQTTKEYSPGVSAFIHRILKSYANASMRSHKAPSFVHWSQMVMPSSLPLSTCLSVITICDKPLPGSEGVAAEVLQREMTRLYEERSTFDDMTLLAAFQAYLIYAMVIFFRLGRDSYPFLRQAMINTQELACETSRRGLMCAAEQHGIRPKWEAWVVAEAKRRTLFTMCLFDSALLTHDGLPSHLATELRGVLAPGSKSLWEARERRDWDITYNKHLAGWPDGSLCIDELWPIPQQFEETDIARRRDRVDTWLEDLDEFGMMIYAVTSSTHGG